MVKKFVAVLGLVVLSAALPATTLAQDANTLLATVAKAMGAENLKTLQYSGAGSTADMTQKSSPDAAPPLVRVKSYKRQMDLNGSASRVELVRVQAGKEQPQTQVIAPNSAWDTQYDFWLNPFGFLKGAASHQATVKPETVFGEKFKVVSFTVQDKYKVNGYINDKNFVSKVETSLDNGTPVQGVYLDYKDFGGVQFPTTIIQKQAGFNTLILIVDNAKAN